MGCCLKQWLYRMGILVLKQHLYRMRLLSKTAALSDAAAAAGSTDGVISIAEEDGLIAGYKQTGVLYEQHGQELSATAPWS